MEIVIRRTDAQRMELTMTGLAAREFWAADRRYRP
jgi:hypothetical protein